MRYALLIAVAMAASVAGYDPQDMANMFKTIQEKSGNGGPQWLSSHPNPGNRAEYITVEAKSLPVQNPIKYSQAFERAQSRLQAMSPALTSEEVAKKRGPRTGRGSDTPSDARIGRVDPPSSRYQTYEEDKLFSVSVPSNWRELPGNDSVTFAPDGGFGNLRGQSVFTHGVQIGVDQSDARNLRTATDEFVDSLAQSNPQIRRSGRALNVTIAGRRGLQTVLTNVSDVTGEPERIALYTTQRGDGSLFYMIGVAPDGAFATYQRVFTRIVSSIRF